MGEIFMDTFRIIFKNHVGKYCIVNIDVRDFFPSITFDNVFRLFAYYGYTKFYRISIHPLFPIKIAPILIALIMGKLFYCVVNQVSFSVEEHQKRTRRMLNVLIVLTILMGFLFRFTGINIAWFII